MKQVNISEAEWRIMQVLWQSSPLELKEIKARLKGHVNWSNTTVRTLLVRLVEKGAVHADKTTGVFKYSPAISETDCIMAETKSFLQRIYRGSAAQFVSHLAHSGQLSENECREILEIISNIKGGGRHE